MDPAARIQLSPKSVKAETRQGTKGPLRQSEPIAAQFQKALEKVISDFSDMELTVGEAIGIIEIVKINTYVVQRKIEADDEAEEKL